MSKTSSQQSKQKLKSELDALIVIAAQHGKSFNNAKSEQQHTLQILSWASKHKSPQAAQHMHIIGGCISPVHRRFFESNGIVFDPADNPAPSKKATTYRGASTVTSNSNTSPALTQDNPRKGKKRVIYRGKETWV